jgi:hypothetical protein
MVAKQKEPTAEEIEEREKFIEELEEYHKKRGLVFTRIPFGIMIKFW